MSSASWHRVLYPGLLLFGLSLPLSKGASNVLLGVLSLTVIVGALSDKEFRSDIVGSCRQPLTAALALFALVAYAGLIHTEKLGVGLGVANKFASLPAIYLLVAVLLQSHPGEDSRTRRAEALLLSFLAGLTVLNLAGVMVFLGALGDARFALPLAPLGLHHIWFSNLNALGLYTAAAFLLFTRHGRAAGGRVLLGSFLALSTLCILLSTSRTAWFGITLTAVTLAAVAIKRKKTIVLPALLCILALVAVYRLVPLVQERTDLIARDIAQFSANNRAATSIGGRIMMWKAAFAMFRAHPIIGVGTGDYVQGLKELRRVRAKPRLVPKFLLEFNQPHNMYLFSMATNGAVGLAALLYVFYRSLRSVVPAVRSGGGEMFFPFLALATVVHFMIAGFMDSFFNIQVLRYAFAFILGVCIRGCVNRSPRA